MLLENSLVKPAIVANQSSVSSTKPTEPELNKWIKTTVNKIRFREELAKASGDRRQELIKKGLADADLTEWVWYRYVKNVEADGAGPELKSAPAPAARVLPLAENLFPKNVTYYAALPQPGATLDKFGSALDGLRLDSARSQANLVLLLSALREQITLKLDSPPGAEPIPYSGIDVKQPIALASWYAEGAPVGIQSAERKAIILRVTDRGRFERTLSLYQQSIGNFQQLTDYSSGSLRFLTVLPAFLPLVAKAILEGAPRSSITPPVLSYGFAGETHWNGYSIKMIEQRRVESSGHLTRDAAYLTYIGDTALLAPDIDSVRDVLGRAASGKNTLAANSDFKRIASGENAGEAIYFSNLQQLAPESASKGNSAKAVIESGALKISNSAWENAFHIQFDRSDWKKPLIAFQPTELSAPRELLPRSTIAYYFMNFDAVAGWRDWSPQLFSPEDLKPFTSAWAIDFEKEVLPELGPECGVAILGLPNILAAKWNGPWAAFCKLKSPKLARAFEAGKLLNVPSATTRTDNPLAMVKGNYLVIASDQGALNALDEKEKLISSRDFSRAIKNAPAGVVAFGGYSLESAASALSGDGRRYNQGPAIFLHLVSE